MATLASPALAGLQCHLGHEVSICKTQNSLNPHEMPVIICGHIVRDFESEAKTSGNF
jgi:hypothetical protein